MKSEGHGNILKYIQNEKDISRYKLSILEKNKAPSPSQRRIIAIEQEFLNLPLENMNFEDVADVAAAISIYRTSRNQFYETYKIPSFDFFEANKNKLGILVKNKKNYLEKVAAEYQSIKVEELNPIQNSDIYYEFIKKQAATSNKSFDFEKKNFDSKKIKDLLEIEPITLAKKRARAQAALYSIGKYIAVSLPNQIDLENLESLKKINHELDRIVENINSNIFSYYNEALDCLPGLMNNTMGENIYLSKLHRIQNILDFKKLSNKDLDFLPNSNPRGFSKDAPMIGNLLFDSKKIIATTYSKDFEKKIQNKVFGILLPIPRESNEKMTLLYKKIIFEDTDISHLFSSDFSNVKGNSNGSNLYYKAILMHPFWKLYGMVTSDDVCKKLLLKLIGLEKQIFKDINFDDKDVIEVINNSKTSFINISNKSRVLSAKTRSEDEGILEIFSIINPKILEIKEEYNMISDRG